MTKTAKTKAIVPSSHASRQLVGLGSIYALVVAAQAVSGYFLLPIITRILQADEYGSVARATVIRQAFIVIAGLGLPAALSREYFSGSTGPHKARTIVVVNTVVLAVLTAIVDLTGRWWAPLLAGSDYTWPLRLAIYSGAPLAVLSATTALFRAQQLAMRYAVITVAGSLGAQILGVAWILIGPPTASSYFLGCTIGGLVVMGLALAWTLPHTGATRTGQVRSISFGALRLGLPTVPHTLSVMLLAVGDRLIIGRLLGLSSVARYQIAYTLGTTAMILVGAIGNAWGPVLYGSEEKDRWRTLAETTRLIAILAAGVAALSSVGAPLALTILAPSEYGIESMVPIVALVAFASTSRVRYTANFHALFQLRRTSSLAFYTPLILAFNVLLNLLLIPPFGLVGAALATVATYEVQAIVVGLAVHRRVKVPWDNVRLRSCRLVAAACSVAGIVVPITSYWLSIRVILCVFLAAGTWVAIRRELDRPGHRLLIARECEGVA